MRVLKKVITFGLLALITGTAYANEVHLVQDPSTNQNLYEVVVESSEGDSKAEPGVYKINRSGRSTLLVQGTVLGVSRTFNGMLALPKSNPSSDSTHGLAVIDGQLVIFNKNTKAKQQRTRVTLGSFENPVIDLTLGVPVTLPLLNDIDGISVVESDPIKNSHLPEGGRTYLISFPALNPWGDGMTLAVTVTGMEKASSVPKIHEGSAIVLNYRQMTEQQLGRLITSEDGSIFSHSYTSLLMQGAQKHRDHPMIKAWMAHVKNYVDYVDGKKGGIRGVKLEHLRRGQPRVDLITRQLNLSDLPARSVTQGNMTVVQVFDPEERKWYLIDSSDSFSVDSKSKSAATLIDAKEARRQRVQILGGKVFLKKDGSFATIETLKNEDTGYTSQLFLLKESSLFLLYDDRGEAKVAILPYSMTKYRKIEFVHRIAKPENSDLPVHVVMTSEITDTGKKIVRAHLFKTLPAAKSLEYMGSKSIVGGSFSLAELDLRTQLIKSKKDGLSHVGFDHFTIASGASNYKQKAQRKDGLVPPFLDVIRWTQGGEPRYYFSQPQKQMEVVHDKVVFRNFSDEDLRQSYSGFYLNYKKTDEFDPLSIYNEDFVAGIPVLSKKSGQGPKHVLDQTEVSLSHDTYAKISVIPYATKPKKGQKFNADTDQVRLLITASTPGDFSKTAYDSAVTLPFGLYGLVGVKIIPGLRQRHNRFDILIFYGKAGTNTKGVYSVHGEVTQEIQGGTTKLNLAVGRIKGIEKESVNPRTLKQRLKSDGAGDYYWIVDPELSPTASKYRVYKLADDSAKMVYINRPGTRVQLRFQEELKSDSSKESFFMGDWLVLSAYDFSNREPRAGEYIDQLKEWAKKDKANKGKGQYWEPGPKEFLRFHSPVSPEFSRYLEKLGDSRLAGLDREGGELRHQVILVEPRLKELFMNQIFVHAMYEGTTFTISGTKKSGAKDVHWIDPTSTKVEIIDEFKSIRTSGGGKRNLVIADVTKILEAGTLLDGQEADEFTDASEEEDQNESAEHKQTPSRWSLFASSGLASHWREYKRVSKKINPDDVVPVTLIATPDEWRNVRETHQDDESAGVFEAFHQNTNFLTSSWTLWPPKSHSVSKEIKEAAKVPIAPEEFKVFPTIEQMLFEAATGKSRGKQKIVIVPDELKPLIQKIIIGRWASSSPKVSGVWHHSNDDLAVYKIQPGTDSVTSQEQVIDNFKSMHGAALKKEVVLLGDMEDINRIGRPFSDSSNYFQISDPSSRSAKGVFDAAENNELKGEGDEAENFTDQDAEVWNFFVDQREAARERMSELSNDNENGVHDAEILEIQDEVDILTEKLNGMRRVAEVGKTNVTDVRAAPHLMWWIAADGKKVQPKNRSEWTLQSEREGDISTIIISTEDELEQLKQDLGFEGKFFDVEEHFELVHLSAPSEQVKFELINSLFDKPEIRSLEYRFVLEGHGYESSRRQLIYHFVNRVEQIAIQGSFETTPAFVRAFAELRRAVVEDVSLRRRRRIDKNYLERLFSKVFPMPINLDNLEEGDPLLKLANIEETAREMQKVGYHGPAELKTRTLETVLSQTRGTDSGRPIPNSQIFFGGTSSGKTYLFRSILKVLGLDDKLYDFKKANNEEAQAIIIPVQSLTEEETNEAGKMSVKQAIESVMDLMATPNGHRAYILFDDAHKTASAKVQQELFSFIQSLFEAENGVVQVRRKGSNEVRDVPVQNLNLYMTVNPTANKDLLKRYSEGEKDLTKLVLAALARDGYNIEDSFLARWSDIININNFPRGAKVPTLVEKIREASQGSSQMVLVEPAAIARLVDRYPDAHARELLNPAASAITSIPALAEEAHLYLVSPKPVREGEDLGTSSERHYLSSAELKRTIRAITQINPVSVDRTESHLRLISFFVNNFRTQLNNYLALEASNSDQLAMPVSGMKSLLKRNFILGLTTHMADHPTLPMDELYVRGDHFSYLSHTQMEEFLDYQRSSGDGSYFPIEFSIAQGDRVFNPNGFENNQPLGRGFERSRRDVLASFTRDVHSLLLEAIAVYMRWPENQPIEDALHWSERSIEEWFEHLELDDQEDIFKEINADLLALYKDFSQELYASDLKEMRLEEVSTDLTMYQQARLFMYVVDKAILNLPWGVYSKFSLDVLRQASDLSLGQKPAFIQYAYSHSISPFAIVTPDFLSESFGGASVDSNGSRIGEASGRVDVREELRSACQAFMDGVE